MAVSRKELIGLYRHYSQLRSALKECDETKILIPQVHSSFTAMLGCAHGEISLNSTTSEWCLQVDGTVTFILK